METHVGYACSKNTGVQLFIYFVFFFLTFCLLFKVGYLFYVFRDAVRVVVFV